MVYLKQIIEQSKERLLRNKNIEQVAYLCVHQLMDQRANDFELSPEEEIAFSGYMGLSTDKAKLKVALNKPPQKGVSVTSNVYKLLGLFLADNELLKDRVAEKYAQSDFKQKYFITKFASNFKERLLTDASNNNDPIAILVSFINDTDVSVSVLTQALEAVARLDIDIQLLILLEDFEKKLLTVKYINIEAEEIVRQILNNFSNAVQKITTNRRQGHSPFIISDEYDVQDILYVILKPLFPNLRAEDPIPIVGAKSTKIDLILREEKILIEAKMIKQSDNNEKHFIEQLKVDIESYHSCQWLDKLFCFVYDPSKKTLDAANFTDLNGTRTKKNHTFDVEIVLVN